MSDQRLIDANIMAEDESEAYLKVQTSDKISPIMQGINSVVHWKIQQLILDTPTIDPETLPIVRELREQLAKVTAERDRAIEDMNIGKCCGNCAYCGDDDFELPFVNCLCSFECRNLSRWEWRGI